MLAPYYVSAPLQYSSFRSLHVYCCLIILLHVTIHTSLAILLLHSIVQLLLLNICAILKTKFLFFCLTNSHWKHQTKKGKYKNTKKSTICGFCAQKLKPSMNLLVIRYPLTQRYPIHGKPMKLHLKILHMGILIESQKKAGPK